LDEDDLDLVAENTGVKRKERKLKRFRRGSASPDGREEAPKKQKDLQHMFSDDDDEPVTSRRTGYYEDEEDEEDGLPSAGQALRAAADRRNCKEVAAPVGFEDEMEDFIDDDESDMEEDLSEGEREARREEKRQQRKADVAARRAKGGGVGGFDPGRAGIDAEAWAELNDVFGDGSEYAFALKIDDYNEEEEDNLTRRTKRADFRDVSQT
jgi:transcription elongation factor SPT6